MTVSLRPYEPGDGPMIHAAAMEMANAWAEQQAAAFRARTAFEFAIVDEHDTYLGGCGLNQLDPANERANLGYWVRTAAARRGVATSAVRQLVHWGFANTTLIRLEVVIAVDNVASLRVAEKAGAVREGVLRSRLLLHGRGEDAVMSAFVRD